MYAGQLFGSFPLQQSDTSDTYPFLKESVFMSCITMKFNFFSLIDSRMGSMRKVFVRRGLIECNYT